MEILKHLAHSTLRFERQSSTWKAIQQAAEGARLTDMQGSHASADAIFDGPGNVLILGEAGAGKTTLLRSRAVTLAQQFLSDASKARRVPLFVGATDLALRRPGNIVAALAECCQRNYGVEIAADTLAVLLQEGRFELLVDGLDELGYDWNVTVADLSDLFRTTPHLRAIVSSRPAALTINFTNFSAYSIRSLDRSRAVELIHTMGRGKPPLTEKFIAAVLDRPELTGLTRSPLMLSLLYEVFVSQGEVPLNRSLLYSFIVDVLFRREREKPRFGWSSQPDLRSRVTSAAAVAMETSGRNTISSEHLTRIASEVFGEQLTYDRLEFEVSTTGLFVEVGPGEFGFVHRSFLEFFVASHFRDDPDGLIQFLHRENGDAILEFASGLIENVAPLVEKAVSQGKLILAAKLVTAGRFENAILKTYVVQAFRQALGSEFMSALTQEPAGTSAAIPVLPSTETSETTERTASTSSTEAPALEPIGAVPHPISAEKSSVAETLLVLLDGVVNAKLPNQERGRVFEKFSASLFGDVFLVVEHNRLTDRGELDLLLDLSESHGYWREFGNEALVECKNLKGKVNLGQATSFITKVQQSRRKLGFIVSFSGFTKDAMRALYDNLSNPTAPVIVAITGAEIRKSLQLGEAVDIFLRVGYRKMTLPRRGAR